MTEQSLTDLLERLGDRSTVSPPPVEQMVARVRLQHRRRIASVTVAATLTVAVAVTGGVAVFGRYNTPPVADRAMDPTATRPPTTAPNDAQSLSATPHLIEVALEQEVVDLLPGVSLTSKRGYVYSTDYEGPVATSPEEAAEIMADRVDAEGDIWIPMYLADGKTVIGRLKVGYVSK